jgi:hypothetical protein
MINTFTPLSASTDQQYCNTKTNGAEQLQASPSFADYFQ